MDKILLDILEYKNREKLSSSECAKLLGISEDIIEKIENQDNSVELSDADKENVSKIIYAQKSNSSRKILKILDLVFRFVAMVMALVTLMLCINEQVDTKVLIVLLSIGLVCSSMTILPKIEK